MNEVGEDTLSDYYQEAEAWSESRLREAAATRRLAIIGAGVAATIAVLEAIALIILLPLKTVVPYTLLVDRQTGFVQSLKPLERQVISPDDALVRSFLAQYVIAREEFDIDSLRSDYTKVALWSAGVARARYLAGMQASNPTSPLATLPRRTLVDVEVRSISPLTADTSLVRFSTVRTDPNGQPQPSVPWASVIKHRFAGETMSASDRLINPLGFQVTEYHRDAEMPVVEPLSDTLHPLNAAPTSREYGSVQQ